MCRESIGLSPTQGGRDAPGQYGNIQRRGKSQQVPCGAAGRAPGPHAGGGFDFARLADGGPDPLVQTGWSLEIGGSGTDGRPQSLMIFIGLRAGWATAQGAFDLHTSNQIQLTIQIAIHQVLCVLAAHLWRSLVKQFVRHCRSRARARAKLDITVPIGMSATSAISL